MPANRKKALQAIEKRGALLVYPLQNRAEPLSLWSELYPRSKMRWEWDADGDDRVASLWMLRAELSSSREVVYAKWFQGRATFFSFETFVHLVAYLRSKEQALRLSRDSANVLDLLRSDSPLSTKQLKAAAELEGRLLEPTYNRAMNPLWRALLIVGFGEFEDSSFPSLGIGAADLLFEDQWKVASKISPAKGEEYLLRKWGEKNPFWRFARKHRERFELEKSEDRDIPVSPEEN